MSKKHTPNKAVENDDNPIENVKVGRRGEEINVDVAEDADDAPADDVTSDVIDTPAKEVKEEAPDRSFMAKWNDAQKAHFDSQSWSAVEQKRWDAVMTDPSAAYLKDTDVLAFDPKREQRPASHWSTDELKAYLQGNLLHVKSHRLQELADEYRRRVAVAEAWTNDDLVHYERTGEEPKKTTSGVWVRDATRDKRTPSQWSKDELKAWAFGEIHTKVPGHRLLTEINQRFDLAIPTHTTDMQRIRKIIEGDQERVESITRTAEERKLTRMNSTHIETVLNQYIAAVKPGQEVTTTTAAIAQNNLERLFVYVTNLEGAALVEGLDKVKKVVAENRKGVFSPTNAHRFTEYVKGDESAKCRHIALLEMFMIVTDPNKSRRKLTDAKDMLRDFPSPKLERLTDYFRNYA